MSGDDGDDESSELEKDYEEALERKKLHSKKWKKTQRKTRSIARSLATGAWSRFDDEIAIVRKRIAKVDHMYEIAKDKADLFSLLHHFRERGRDIAELETQLPSVKIFDEAKESYLEYSLAGLAAMERKFRVEQQELEDKALGLDISLARLQRRRAMDTEDDAMETQDE